MALTDAEVKMECARWRNRSLYGAGGGFTVGLPMPNPLWGLITDAARRVDVAAGTTPGPRTGEDFVLAACMLAVKAVSGSPSDAAEFARAGYPSSGWFAP